MTVKISSSLPVGDTNGLSAISGELCEDPEKVHVAVVLLDCAQITTNVDNGDVVPTARIRAIEPIRPSKDANEMQRLIRRAYERRTGKVELPLEMEQEFDELSGDDQ